MHKTNTTILIPDGENDLALKVLRCLGAVPNLHIYVLSRDKKHPIRSSKYCRKFFSHTVDAFDHNRLDVILGTARKINADIIFPIDQPTIRLIAEYRSEVEKVATLPPLASTTAIDIAADKWLLTNVLEQEGIPHPQSVHFEKGKPADFSGLDFPVLAKPLVGESGRGIERCETLDELTAFLNSDKSADVYLVQSFIQGYDIDCSVLCENGEIKAHTIQKSVQPGKNKYEPASTIEFVRQEQVYKITEELMRALNWSGVAHVDMMYDEKYGIPRVLEINPRWWASVIGSLVAGVNFPHLALQMTQKKAFPQPEYKLVQYTKPEVAYGLLLKKFLFGNTTIKSIKQTGIPYALSDLGPEMVKILGTLVEFFS
jgi:D-aspartate ligase